MARPIKQGIDYYPMEVGFLDDIKVRKIMRSCGAQAISILICLLGYIYGENGYFIEWEPDMPFLIADKIGISEGAVDEVVTKAIQVDFFDRNMFEAHRILTSRGIQKRFEKATERRTEITWVSDYILININEDNNAVNVINNPINDSSNEQRKVKESKVKESKEYKAFLEQSFEEFWTLYPKKVGKAKATQSWQKLSLTEDLLEAIKHALEIQMQSEQWTKDGGQYIPNPSTWLNQERWNDDPKSYPKGGTIKRTNGKSDNVGNFQQRQYSEEDYSKFYVDIMKEKI